MKAITKKIIGIMQAVLIGLSLSTVCMAEEQYDLEEAIPIAPYGVIDTATPTYEWTSVSGATIYCLLVETNDGVPLYLAWYTDEEAGCSQGEEVCSITPQYCVYGDVWSVLPCADEECGSWGPKAPFSTVPSNTTLTRARPADQNTDGRIADERKRGCMRASQTCLRSCKTKEWQKIASCVNKCKSDYTACMSAAKTPREVCNDKCKERYDAANQECYRCQRRGLPGCSPASDPTACQNAAEKAQADCENQCNSQ